ncbi:MAG TPA: polysaccharide biosynthesis tyrosine autokinase, partial [Candidatus Caenarcaniphilales bacterium]
LELTRYTENHPAVASLQLRRDQLLSLIQRRAQAVVGTKTVKLSTGSRFQEIQQGLTNKLLETQATLVGQQAQLESTRRAEAEVAARFSQIPSLQLTYTELQRQFQLNSDNVNFLLKKLQELKVVEAQEITPWEILSPPSLPTEPISPDILRNLLLGLLASILLGWLLAVLLEQLDERLEGVEEARDLTKLPLLGSIPRQRKQAQTLTVYQPAARGLNFSKAGYNQAQFKESLYALAFNLRYLCTDSNIKTILFTSAIPAEGKSTITYNLGAVLAELGLRVIVIDAELRKPTLHKFLQGPNTLGLTTALTTERPWQQVVQTSGLENLDIITAGPHHPTPIPLLDSAKMSDILNQCRQVYDYVLIDTPPILGLADARSLISRVDTSILVTGIGRSNRSLITRAAEILQDSKGGVAGLIVNFMNRNDSNSYYRYYSSYYNEPIPEVAPQGVAKQTIPVPVAVQETLNHGRRG